MDNKAHNDDFQAARFGQATWRESARGYADKLACSYCGSMTPAEAIRILLTPGEHYSGSDWKYGWPAKFYLGSGKFYAVHLLDATEAELMTFNKAAATTIRVQFEITDKGLAYRAPHAGFQTWGVVPDKVSDAEDGE